MLFRKFSTKYQPVPATWKCLQKYHKQLEATPLNIIREPSVDFAFDLHQNLHGNMTHFIQKKYLKKNPYALVKNDFPYFTEQNISHHILWFRDFDVTIDKVDEILNSSEILFQRDFIYWRNARILQTVRGINHFQIFSKRIEDF
jgi:hypothetical protein